MGDRASLRWNANISNVGFKPYKVLNTDTFNTKLPSYLTNLIERNDIKIWLNHTLSKRHSIKRRQNKSFSTVGKNGGWKWLPFPRTWFWRGNLATWFRYFITFYSRNLHMGPIRKSVFPSRPYKSSLMFVGKAWKGLPGGKHSGLLGTFIDCFSKKF